MLKNVENFNQKYVKFIKHDCRNWGRFMNVQNKYVYI